MESSKRDILLGKYQNGELTAEETKELALLRDIDQELDEEIRFYDEADKSLGDSDMNDFVHSTKPDNSLEDVTDKKRNNILLVVASVSFIAIVSVLSIWILGMTTDTDEIYQAYYKPFPDLTNYSGNSLSIGFTKGMQAYNASDFELAIDLLRNSEKEQGLADFYLGVSYMSLNRFDEALNSFESSKKNISDQSILYSEINWYQALCYLKKDNFPMTKSLLTGIKSMEGKHAIQANSILDALGDR